MIQKRLSNSHGGSAFTVPATTRIQSPIQEEETRRWVEKQWQSAAQKRSDRSRGTESGCTHLDKTSASSHS